MFKEFRIAILVSTVLAVVNGLRIYIQYQDIQMAVVIAIALVAIVILSKFIGCFPAADCRAYPSGPGIDGGSADFHYCGYLLYFDLF